MEYTYIHSQILSLQQKTKTSAFELQTQHRMAIIPYEPKEERSESRLRCRVGFALFCKYLLLSNTVAIVMPADRLRCGRCFAACKEISAKLKDTEDLNKRAHAYGEWSGPCCAGCSALAHHALHPSMKQRRAKLLRATALPPEGFFQLKLLIRWGKRCCLHSHHCYQSLFRQQRRRRG